VIRGREDGGVEMWGHAGGVRRQRGCRCITRRQYSAGSGDSDRIEVRVYDLWGGGGEELR
jgi:hypothetical protein